MIKKIDIETEKTGVDEEQDIIMIERKTIENSHIDFLQPIHLFLCSFSNNIFDYRHELKAAIYFNSCHVDKCVLKGKYHDMVYLENTTFSNCLFSNISTYQEFGSFVRSCNFKKCTFSNITFESICFERNRFDDCVFINCKFMKKCYHCLFCGFCTFVRCGFFVKSLESCGFTKFGARKMRGL